MLAIKRTIRILMIVVITFSLCLVISCQRHRYETEGGTHLEQNWGRAFEAAKYNQTLYPEGPKELDPQDGLDGKAAEGVMERYWESFNKEESASETVITIQ